MKHSRRYDTIAENRDRLTRYNVTAKFDETVEIAANLGVDPRHADQQVRGTVVLPNGDIIRTGSTGLPEKQSVDCLLVTRDNADRFGTFELLPEPAEEPASTSPSE